MKGQQTLLIFPIVTYYDEFLNAYSENGHPASYPVSTWGS